MKRVEPRVNVAVKIRQNQANSYVPTTTPASEFDGPFSRKRKPAAKK